MKPAAPALLVLYLALVGCSSTTPRVTLVPQRSGPPTPPKPARANGDEPAQATVTAVAAGATPTPLGEGPQTASMVPLRIGGERYATLGDPGAPITMVEFSDYGCPYCRLYNASGFPELKRRFVDTGQVYYIFKDFPVVELHPQAVLAAQAAECAGEQGGYWEFHNQLFADPRAWEAGPEAALDAFGRYADAIGMDGGALQTCVGEGRYAAEVRADYGEARALGLAGTPAFIINGKLLSGARAPEQFVQVLEREVANAVP